MSIDVALSLLVFYRMRQFAGARSRMEGCICSAGATKTPRTATRVFVELYNNEPVFDLVVIHCIAKLARYVVRVDVCVAPAIRFAEQMHETLNLIRETTIITSV
jgi:hypothetical protein